jgi:proteic killer suppression protein
MPIRSFRHKGLRELFVTNTTKGVRPDLIERCRDRLTTLQGAKVIEQLQVPGWRLHRLRGEARWAIAVNGPWRITFAWDDGEVYDIDLEQYH